MRARARFSASSTAWLSSSPASGCLASQFSPLSDAPRRSDRKVSGARTGQIARLMLWRISLPVLIANLVAWPVAYYYLHRWLDHLPDTLSAAYFLVAGAAALVIAWVTVYGNKAPPERACT